MIKVRELDNGAKLVYEVLPHVQSVATGIWVKTGAVNEVPEYAGISHFVEHMMFKGTSSHNAKELAEAVDKIGGQINAFTGKEATCYYVKTISQNLYKGIDVIVEMLEDSVFATAEMDKERKVVCEEIKMTMDSPDDLAHDTITSLVLSTNPLGNSIIGTPETLERIDHDIMKKYVEEHYTTDSIVISMAGNFDEDKVIAYFDKKFKGLGKKQKEAPDFTKPYVPQYKSISKDIEQTHMCFAVPGVNLLDPDIYAVNILTNTLGGSMSSRLFQHIREELGLAYSVFALSQMFSTGGYFDIYAGIAHDKVERTTKAIKDELLKLQKMGISKEEMESSRAQMMSQYIFGQENVTGRMFRNGKNLAITNRVMEAEEVIDNFNKVTIEDIERVSEKIANIENYCGVVVSNKEVDLESIIKN